MRWFLSALLSVASLHGTDKEIEGFLNSLVKPPIKEVISFLEQPNPTSENVQKKCSFHSPLSDLPINKHENSKLLVFTSFSLPLESWKEFSHFLEKTGGSFVLRGLPKNSFSVLSKKIVELKKAGVQAQILLDPESFDKYAIDAIPSVILDDGKHHDKVSGNIKLPVALSLFAGSGTTKILAKDLLTQGEVH